MTAPGPRVDNREEFQAAVDQSIAWCVEAGGRAVHCMAGVVGDGDGVPARRTFVENLAEASLKAEPHGLTLLLEPINPKTPQAISTPRLTKGRPSSSGSAPGTSGSCSTATMTEWWGRT